MPLNLQAQRRSQEIGRIRWGVSEDTGRLNRYGKPIRKPWTIATSMRELNLLCRRCEHKPSEHAPCAGADTKVTEGYTDDLVINLHAAVKQWCDSRGAR